MANILEEKLREASCLGDLEAVQSLISRNIDVNSQNSINGWTALHWACKRGNEKVVRLLLANGADPSVKNSEENTPADICSYSNITELLNVNSEKIKEKTHVEEQNSARFVPNYIRNAPISAKVDLGPVTTIKQQEIYGMQNITLTAASNDELVLKIKIHGSSDPDFIEVEIPKLQLTYKYLVKLCCEQLDISESQIERIRKLPNTRLRNDKDVGRLENFQALEIVLKNHDTEKNSNGYQSISTCKDQTVLY